jgi:hypothetical protein
MVFLKNKLLVRKNELFIIKIFYNLFLVFEESFSLLDKDGDGNITTYEIRSLMNSLGYSPSEEDISTVISKVDTNGKIIFKKSKKKILIIHFNR